MDSKEIEDAKRKFYWCCAMIVENSDSKALNYCVNYAKAGLAMSGAYFILVQIPYIQSNMTYWRGSTAKAVRECLKEVYETLKKGD